MSERTKIALVFGGRSSEHGISCLTAASVLGAIDRERFDVVAVGISKSGRWSRMSLEEVADLRISGGATPEVPEPEHDAVWLVGEHGGEIATRVGDQLVDVQDVDVVFAPLHGPYGEDGTIQGMFEMMGIRYVGPGVLASAVGMDKHFMKLAFEAAGLPVGPYVVASERRLRLEREAVLAEVAGLGFPVFVKPARGGSSIGITRVTDPSGLEAAIAEAQRHDPKVIFEQGFVGTRELEVAVLGDPGSPEGCRASVVGEIRVQDGNGFYDFATKYLDDDGAALDAPARTTPELAATLQRLACRAFNALGAEGLVRADFFATEDQAWINEVNTMPGFTRISMYPALWQATGISYPELVTRLIELALERPVGLR